VLAMVCGQVNVEGTRNVISACLSSGVKKLVYTSTLNVVFNYQPVHDGTCPCELWEMRCSLLSLTGPPIRR